VTYPAPKKRKIMRSLKINEISAVDKAAQIPAALVLMKRDAEDLEKVLMKPKSGESRDKFVARFMSSEKAKAEFPEEDQRLAVAYSQFKKCGGHDMGFKKPAMTTAVDGHTHLLDDSGNGGETSYTRSEGEEYGHTHPWIRLMDGALAIGMAEGHTHSIVQDPSITSAKSAQHGDQPMTATTDKQAITPEELTKAQKRAERAEAIVKLTSEERAHFDTLKPEAQDGFLAKSAVERSTEVRKSADSNREVYKSRSGQVFRASDDPRLVDMARENDANAAKLQEAVEKSALATFEKRAATELPSLPGTDAVKAGILKALEGVPGAPEFLKAAENAAKGAFTKAGTQGGGEPLSVPQQLEVLAQKFATDHKVPILKARAEVLETPEGQALYKQMA